MGKIYLTGADNARDLGGMKTMDGGVLRSGHLLRSNRLSRITKKDIQILEDQYHLHKIIDLRTPMEVEQEADAESPAADYGDERGSGAVALYGRKRQMRTAVCHDVIFAGSI